MPEGVDIDPLQLAPFADCLDPFLVGPRVGIGSPLGGEDEILGIGMPLVKLDLPVEHKQPPDVFIDRRFPITGLAFGGLLEDQLGFLAGWVVKELHPFQVLADTDGPLLLVEVAPSQGKDLPHPCPLPFPEPRLTLRKCYRCFLGKARPVCPACLWSVNN